MGTNMQFGGNATVSADIKGDISFTSSSTDDIVLINYILTILLWNES
jgi:hypothetical protein